MSERWVFQPKNLKVIITFLGLSLGLSLIYFLFRSGGPISDDDFTPLGFFWFISTLIVLPLIVLVHVLCWMRLWLESFLRPRGWLGLDADRHPYQIGIEEKITITLLISITLPYLVAATTTLPYIMLNGGSPEFEAIATMAAISIVDGVLTFKHIKFLAQVSLVLD